MRPTAVIGDVHGDADLLQEMLSDPQLADRRLVFVGDYVNRGLKSREVINLLIELKTRAPLRVTFLSGNHDQAFLDVLRGGSLTHLLLMGGASTVRAWVPEVVGDVGAAITAAVSGPELDFLASLEDEWACDDVLVRHARPTDFMAGETSTLLVVGHHIQRDFIPKIVDGCAYLDTGCGSVRGGRLSALLLPERVFVSH